MAVFRIRRIFDNLRPINREAMRQVQEVLREQFPGLSQGDIDKLPEVLRNPVKYRFQSILYVAEDAKPVVKGFALMSMEAEFQFCYLDYISTAKGVMGGGVGGALYERLREEALTFNAVGLFFECLPDDQALCADPGVLRQNAARLKFYEKYGALPIVNTAYETPVLPGDDCPPYLVLDRLGRDRPLRRREAQVIVRAILERKYGELCSPEYVDMVVESFRDDPVRQREPRHIRREESLVAPPPGRLKRVALVVNDRHAIHHVKERGYVESPVRIPAILRELERTNIFERVPPREFPERFIRSVHSADYFEYFKRVCKALEPGKSVYPYVFPLRNTTRPPTDLVVRAGYYCIDTFTPINQNAFLAAKRSVECALTAATMLLEGHRLAYALVRPPGHHAERRSFGGFCYFNSAAIAAQMLSEFGKVAILDIDYHHGNGQQTIFYDRSDVLTLSIHGHPRFAYPYFSGFEDERGVGEGMGFNINYPLAEQVDGAAYIKALERAMRRVREFGPAYLVVCLGLDTAKGDPTGTWTLGARDYHRVGGALGMQGLPTLVVQEGGYRTRGIGINARHFFLGLWSRTFGKESGRNDKTPRGPGGTGPGKEGSNRGNG